ncbi:MAG: glycosyltransferase family 2 protein [Parachlamydiaceae bacterium]|nr:glycosyltransferase family 2 protein [Parachlamydiaceae bacterium]
MKTTVDILLATYQGRFFIEEQINSLMQQTYGSFRLVISDDGSSDGTWEWLNDLLKNEQLQHKIILLPRGERRGVVANFSYLLQHATAPYIMFADQDDVWYPEKIEKTLKKMQASETQYGTHTPILVHTDLTVVDHNRKSIHSSFWQYTRLNGASRKQFHQILTQNVVTGCTVMINRALADLAQPIPKAACMHDWWLALVAAAFGKIEALNEATLDYRQHGQNQIGAQQYGLQQLRHQKLWLTNVERKRAQAAQARCFEEKYTLNLSIEHKSILVGYQDYCGSSFWRKRKAIIQYKFYKKGLLRNVYEFCM